MWICAVCHDTVWHAASSAWQFGPSLVDFPVQGSTPVFNTKALLPASGLCLPIQWSCTGKLQDFQETLLFDTTALIKKSIFSNHRSYLIHRSYSIPKSNSSLNSHMMMKWCTKLDIAKKRCPMVFQGHPSNFKVTPQKKSSILTQIGRFHLLYLQFEFTNGYKMMHKAWSSIEEVPCCF